MKFDIIATQRHSQCDVAGIFQFKSEALAKTAAEAINDSPWVNSKDRVQLGYTGALQVGNCVVCNAYSEVAFANIRKTVESLNSEEEIKELWKDLWDSLNDVTEPYYVARKHAVDYFRKVFPDATVKTDPESEHKFTLKYRGETFTCSLHYDDDDEQDSRIILYKGDTCKFPLDISLERDNDTDAVKKIFSNSIDPETPGVTPETAMFDLIKTINFSKNLPAAAENKIKGIASLFFQSWLKEATLVCVESSDNLEIIKWVEVWFKYKGKKYHLDFCMEDGKNTLTLWTTNKYEENVDCTYVTTGNLQEKIDSVDKDGHFPDNSKEEPGGSLEERLDKVERLIADLQDEVKEIKKKL